MSALRSIAMAPFWFLGLLLFLVGAAFMDAALRLEGNGQSFWDFLRRLIQTKDHMDLEAHKPK